MKIKKLGAFFLACLILAAMVGCNTKTPPEEENPISSEVSNPENDVTPEVQNPDEVDPVEPEVIPEPEPEPEPEVIIFKNPLTGLETTEELSKQRPVAIMFNNIKAALPQVGISEVDVLYEITVEGAITRLMGVANNWASLPTIGSVRSSRDYFIDISDAHNAIYVHAGGSDYAYSELWARKTERIDGTNGTRASGAAFYRDSERMKTMAIEHTLVTNGEKLAKAIEGNGFGTQYRDGFVQPLTFADSETEISGADANYVYIPFSFYAQSYLDYNSETKLYSKGQYLGTRSSLDKHDSPHIDGNTGKALEFKNVIVLYAPHSSIPGDTKGRISVDITGSGKGYYITNGKSKAITWEKESRTSSYKLYEANETEGKTELSINPGKTYIAIVPTTSEVVFK